MPALYLSRFPLNVWILAGTLSLVMTAIPLMVLVSGLIGTRLAPRPDLATLPLACAVVGTALATLPAAFTMRAWGRRGGGFVGIGLSFVGALTAAAACQLASFGLLLLAGGLLGSAAAFYQQFRFAAIESVEAGDAGPAVAVVMLSGVISALIGPELGVWGRDWAGLAPFTGSFLLLAMVVAVAALVFGRFRAPPVRESDESGARRPLRLLVSQGVFLRALAAAAIGYGVMSFLMTSTPISMHEMHGHSLGEAKWVIQSHLLAMFLPSLFAGALLKALGVRILMRLGAALYLAVLLLALAGHSVMHYWGALVLLGVGWNFLFLTGTTLLPQAYRGGERFAVQAVNDLVIFSVQAAASLGAGWVLYRFGWTFQVALCLVPVAVIALVSGWPVGTGGRR